MDDRSSPGLPHLRRQWRDATREWLAARNEMARLQDATLVDLRAAIAAARRLEQAELGRDAVNRQVEAALEALAQAGGSSG